MPNYSNALASAPRTLTDDEQRDLLRVSGARREDFRDHVLFSLALGTGLREHEILALNCGDVFDARGTAVKRVLLRVFKRCSTQPAAQEVVLPDVLRAKLTKYRMWKQQRGEDIGDEAPVFVSRNGNRLSARQVRHLFSQWQVRAGFGRRISFHALRHTACSTLYRQTKDIRLTQRFARHASIVTTGIYAHPGDEELSRAVQQLPC